MKLPIHSCDFCAGVSAYKKDELVVPIEVSASMMIIQMDMVVDLELQIGIDFVQLKSTKVTISQHRIGMDFVDIDLRMLNCPFLLEPYDGLKHPKLGNSGLVLYRIQSRIY